MGTFEVLALAGSIVALAATIGVATIGMASLRPEPAPMTRRREFPAPGPRPAAAQDTLPVSIYLADAEIHYPVQAAATRVLAAAGLRIHSADDPVLGSWFRHLRAAVDCTPYAPAARGGTLTVPRTHLVLARDAAITETLLRNAGAVITALQPTPDAVVRLGAVLIVKANSKPMVVQLTAAQQARLDDDPGLASSPRAIASALGITSHAAARCAGAAHENHGARMR
jgi:hypothetical protein